MSAVLLVLVALIQLFWLQGPFDRDASVYWVIAQELLKGRTLYSDLWDHKPPAIHAAYFVALLCVENPMFSLWLLGTTLGFLTGVGLVVLLRRVTTSISVQVVFVALWLILFCSPNLEASQPNTEAFINLCWVWAAVMLGRSNAGRTVWVFGACLVGAATVFKPIAIVLFIPVFILFVHQGCWSIRRFVSAIALFVGVPVLMWTGLYGYFWSTGRAEDFYLAIVVYNRAYAGDLLSNIWNLFSISRLFPDGISGLYLPLALCVASVVFDVFRMKSFLKSCLVFFALVATYVAIALPGNFYLHYYQYLLPIVVVVSGSVVARFSPLWARCCSALILGAAAAPELMTAFFPQQFQRAPLYSGSPGVDALTVATILRSKLEPGEWFYEFGAQPALYIETGVRPRHGALHVSWLVKGPAAEILTFRTLEVLKRDPPALVVISLLFIDVVPGDPPILKWVEEHYEEGVADTKYFRILRRKKMPS